MLPDRGDAVGSVRNLFTRQSDWIHYQTTVSTSADQIALAPGYLQKDWVANGRHYFSYDMGDVQTLDFFAYISPVGTWSRATPTTRREWPGCH